MPHTPETNHSTIRPPVTFEGGELVADERYQIISGLGFTDTSEVYKAQDWESGQQAALKIYHDETPEAYVRNTHELQLVQALDSPYIISAIEVGSMEHRDLIRRYLATPLAEGTLRNYIVTEEDETDEVIGYLRDTAIGIRVMHDLGILHQDIKPGNIFVCKAEERAKIGDLGTAKSTPAIESDKAAAENTRGMELDPRSHHIARILGEEAIVADGCVIGTSGFMSPEQRKGVADEGSDVFAFGATGIKVLTGRELDIEPTRHLDDCEVSPRVVYPGPVFMPRSVPRDVRNIIYACVEARPEDRPTDEELVAALDANTSR